MYEDLVARLREDADNQERVLHVCDSTINARLAAKAIEDMDAQMDVLVHEDVEAQQEREERSKGCVCCNDTGWLDILNYTIDTANFCPMCGRRLKGDA